MCCSCHLYDCFFSSTLEEGMATHSSILAWRIPWTEEPGRLHRPLGHKIWHNGATDTYPLPGLFFAESGLKTPGKWGAQVLNLPLLQLLLASIGSGQGDALQFMNPSSPPLCSPILLMLCLGSLPLLFPPQSFPDPGSWPSHLESISLSRAGHMLLPPLASVTATTALRPSVKRLFHPDLHP